MGASMYTTYKSQQSKTPLSPVSPLESNGQGWKYPPIAKSRLKGQGTISKVPLEEVRSQKRLSRPFEQPYQIPTSGQRQVSARPMQANLKRADSYKSQQPARVPQRKPAPLTLTIPAPTYQARQKPGQNPNQESQTSAARSDRRQKKETRVQRSVRHQGWDPLKEPRLESTTKTNNKNDGRADGHSHDLERQDKAWPYSKPRGRMSADDRGGRRCCISQVLIAVVAIIVIAVYLAMRRRKVAKE